MMTPTSWERRGFMHGAGAMLLSSAVRSSAASAAESDIDGEVAAIETALGGRIGLAAKDTGSGATLSHRGDQRFAMASTFKWTLAAFVLSKVDKGEIALDQPIAYGKADLLPHAPVTASHLGAGHLSVEALARAAIEVSDNTAANLLLRLCGGPAGLTGFLRTSGDTVTRLDRIEMNLNTNIPGDERDTTTPKAMVGTMRRILLGPVLSIASRDRLIGWLKDCETGRDRLRAGLPPAWIVGDKTGTGANGAVNDLAIAWRARIGASPILIACYMSGSTLPVEKLSAAQVQIGSLVASRLG